jgi:peptidase A4-like protein
MRVNGPRVAAIVIGSVAALAMAVGGMAAVTLAAAGNTAARPAHVTTASKAELSAKARIALTRFLREGYKPSAELVRPGGANLKAGASGTTAVGSFNWSGYADSSATPNTFTAVSAKWRQPGTVCSPEQELTAYWVGLDGYSNETVEQDGTLAYCFEGVAYYYTWWEMYPGESVTVGSTVQPGDVIAASVKRSGTSYKLSLTDFNNPANSFSTVQSCTTCQNESAEWIAERPAFSIGITPLTFFRTWNPVGAVQTSNGARGTIAAGPNPTQITMFDATQTYPLDTVSGLFARGSSFAAHWLNSY